MTTATQRLQHCPTGRTPFIVPGSARKKIHIACDLMQPPVIVNLRDDPVDENWRFYLSEQELNYFKTNGNNVTVFIHGFNVPYGKFSHHVVGTSPRRTGRGSFRYDLPNFHESSLATTYRDLKIIQKRFPDIKRIPDEHLENLNGTGAHSWIPNLEKSLNKACGFDVYGDDYSKYTRCIHIMWSGDVPPQNYMQAELNATIAAGRALPLFKQLIKSGLKINIIAHSLGNRVLLVALNELGKQAATAEKIHNAFMWQPAVPDTALSTNPDMDTSVMQNWQLPHAYKGAKYNSSIGPIPISINIKTGVPAQDDNDTYFFNQERWRKGWEALARRQKAQFDKAMQACDSPYTYICGIEGAKKAKFYNPRPAMGYDGPYTTTDKFIDDLVTAKKIDVIDQKEWLFEHSSMKIPSDELFENIIKKVIMNDNIMPTTGFGKY